MSSHHVINLKSLEPSRLLFLATTHYLVASGAKYTKIPLPILVFFLMLFGLLFEF